MKFILISIIFSIASTTMAQDMLAFKKMVFQNENGAMPYRLLLPKNYDASKKYPLVLFLHGSGERGSDNEAQLAHASELFLKEEVREKYPAIVVFPQCAANTSWARIKVGESAGENREFTFYKNAKPTSQMLLLEGLLKSLKKKYRIEKKRMYVGGLSMGGFGTFELVNRNPKMFAAAFPICGGGNPVIAKKLKKATWWVFHGDSDTAVPSKYSTQMVEAMQQADIGVKYSLYPNVGHNSWENALAEPELLPWLFSKSR